MKPLARHANRPTHLMLSASLLASLSSWATPSPALDRASISLGAFFPNSADTRLDLAGKGQSLNTGKLNLNEKSNIPRARFDFLLGDRQGFSFGYYRLKRERTLTDNTSFDLDGHTYDVGVKVSGSYRLDMADGSYRWWFGEGNTVAGVGLGAAYYRLKTEVNASANDQRISGNSSYDRHTFAPMLTVGLRHAFNDDLRLYMDGAGVYKDGGEGVRGNIYNAAVGLEYFPTKQVGLGAEYGMSKINLKRSTDDYDARLNLHLEGPSAFVRLRF